MLYKGPVPDGSARAALLLAPHLLLRALCIACEHSMFHLQCHCGYMKMALLDKHDIQVCMVSTAYATVVQRSN